MATRSTIALEYADGTVDQIYCHWDGYLDHNGTILNEHYHAPSKVQCLMELGNLSSLGNAIGDKHDFGESTNNCTFYGRDRGEHGTEAQRFASYKDYCANARREDYNYILRRDGNWYVEYYSEFDGLLTDALNLEGKSKVVDC